MVQLTMPILSAAYMDRQVRRDKRHWRQDDGDGGQMETTAHGRAQIRNREGVEPLLSLTGTPHSKNMAPKTYTWVSAWFLLTAPIIAWDAMYCFMRPRSMEGGDLHWIWEPYSIYQRVDLVYGIPALEEGDGFTNAQSFMNVVETLLNLIYVYTAHVKAWPSAPLIGLSAAVMTLSKTVLYWLQEYYCNYCAVGHNTLYDLIVYWLIPNGLWLVLPTLIINRLARDLSADLTLAAKASEKAKSK
ncbi:hypothetical protein MKEN_00507400 [Mycena kentingensis (nom. inval.)]|nr:hypothetical protein MKEN_00507400 [Mycena kentingensis (nom. inval.)]